jgi:tetratricopeptide (TPR) repeat protein
MLFSVNAAGGLLSTAPTTHHRAMDKIAAFHEILQLDANNAFARYGLAMEHVGQGNPEKGLEEFSTLLGINPDYVPAYQMSAQTLVKLGRNDEALARLHEGIAAANRTGNQHALAEMEGMREELHP